MEVAKMALTTPRKSAPYIPSWPLIPPEEPCVRFFLLEWNATDPTNAGSMQEEKERVMQVWNEMKNEEKEVYYKEYEQDLTIYWRMQMVICGCHTCRQEIQSHSSILDVTHFVNKLKQSQDRKISKERQKPKVGINTIEHGAQVKQNLVSTCEVIAKSVNSVEQNVHTEELQQVPQQWYKNSNEKCCETNQNTSIEFKEEMPIDFHSETCNTAEHGCLRRENNYSKFVDKKTTQLINISPDNNCKLPLSKNSKENSSEVSNSSVVTRGYPFTTTNCMDFSDNESDVSEEVSLQDLVRNNSFV
ncbi:uncharacterized protein [Antedon mediterranea]|uniref:uncharacterized protein n=1 Tax=Antedon mediterranea TaxID=105859 RepID=UPI003AF9E26E